MKKYLLFTIVAGAMIFKPMGTKAQEAYAALSNDNTTLTFYYDNEKSSRNGMDIGPFEGEDVTQDHQRGWHDQAGEIETVIFDNSFANMTGLTSTAYWFYRCKNLSTIKGIENLKTDNVTDMKMMFLYCESLTNIDVRGFNTKNVRTMEAMFAVCVNLEHLDLSNFVTENVEVMWSMFECCYALKTLDISSFNTSNTTNFRHMFTDCYALNALDISHFRTERATDMAYMFRGCKSLSILDLSSFDTSNVTTMEQMFRRCESLNTIYVSNAWTTEKIATDDYYAPKRLFEDCPNLVGGSGTTWDENHVDVDYAHIDGGTSNPGYLTFKEKGGASVIKASYDVDKKETGCYTLSGTRTQGNHTKGIYIRNGKKYIAK